MKYAICFLLLVLLPISSLAVAADRVEYPQACGQCGMDRTTFAKSRMLIVYADGTAMGVCSIHCAAAGLHNSGDKKVGSLMVADYTTKKLIDAKSAVWVVGGKKNGVMTAEAKWAFGRTEDATRFMAENGGIVNSFDRVMKAAIKEVIDLSAEERAVEREIIRELQ